MNTRVTNLESEFVPLGVSGQELTVADTAIALDDLPAAATHAMLSVKSNPVHMGFSGSPTTSIGILLPVGTLLILPKAAIAKALFIRSTGSSGVIGCEPGTF